MGSDEELKKELGMTLQETIEFLVQEERLFGIAEEFEIVDITRVEQDDTGRIWSRLKGRRV